MVTTATAFGLPAGFALGKLFAGGIALAEIYKVNR
jgi:hypothetical protein